MFDLQQLLQQFAQQASPLIYPDREEIPLFGDNSPREILYSYGIPSANNQPQKISIDQFMEIYKKNGGTPFHYTETVWFHPRAREAAKIIDRSEQYKEFRETFIKFLSCPQILTQKLIVSFISKEVGFGVFAAEDIPIYNFVAVYTGVFGAPTPLSNYCLSDPVNLNGWSIDASKRGGISRFFQHMPRSMVEYYKEYELLKQGKGKQISDFFISSYLDKLLKESATLSLQDFVARYSQEYSYMNYLPYDLSEEYQSIAGANIGYDYYILDGLPIFVFYSNKPISRFSPIGFDYGRTYWDNPSCSLAYVFKRDGTLSQQQHICVCGAVAIKRCTRCKQQYYCSLICQRNNWSSHKLKCMSPIS